MDEADRSYLCLSDFVAPESAGVRDYVGLFAVTAGIGADSLAQKYQYGATDSNNNPIREKF